ncbi:MAG: hypothetical protein IKR25_02955 [Muribaculaceae bacterium]|nr:hypothetical protein [Muribaculaceae bacterium]
MNRKISIALLLAAIALTTACSGKYEEWYEPQGGDRPQPVSVAFDADSVSSIDLRVLTGDTVRIFRPTIVCEKPYTVTYSVNIFNANRSDSVTIKAWNGGRALRADVQQALMVLYGPNAVEHVSPMDITANILVEGTAYRGHADSIPLTITPREQQLPPVWYVMGSHIGDGSWNNTAEALYSSLIPMYANPLNYSELVYAGYFPAGSQLRIVPEVGNNDYYIGGGDETGGQSVQNEDIEGDPIDNIVISHAGCYRVIVNVSKADPSVRWERIEQADGIRVYNSMALTHPAIALAPATTAAGSQNHDWKVSALTLDEESRVAFSGTYVAAVDSTGTTTATVTLGGNAFPVGRASAGTEGSSTASGSYTLMYNDLVGTYRFIKQ